MGHKPTSSEITKEIRQQHSFGLADMVGREGAGFMKGESPVPAAKQAELAIRQHLGAQRVDPLLAEVLVLRLRPARLEALAERPLEALAEALAPLLATEATLVEFVRQVDQRWGREMDERPHFQAPGEAPHPDDEHTHDSVRQVLESLRQSLA